MLGSPQPSVKADPIVDAADAAAKAAAGLPAECAGTAERDALELNCRLLRMAGAKVPQVGTQGTFAGIELSIPPLVVLLPSFATCKADVRARFKPGSALSMTARSSLVLQGDVTFEGEVSLDGALVIKASHGASVG